MFGTKKESLIASDRRLEQTRHIGDFRGWKNHGAYQIAFPRLLRDLKAGESAGTGVHLPTATSPEKPH